MSLVPYGVSTNLLFATREIVEISSPVFSAMSFRIIGFSFVSSPVMKNSSWWCMMAFMVTISVS